VPEECSRHSPRLYLANPLSSDALPQEIWRKAHRRQARTNIIRKALEDTGIQVKGGENVLVFDPAKKKRRE
jgi:hypothetical protein